jgi:tRNA nucleotidyltransferase (CCA-adding enzyme)
MAVRPPPGALAATRFPEEILEVLRTLQGAGHKAYLVGGLVRDLLLGRPGADYDVATSARAQQVIGLFRRVVPTGVQHGTVTVLTRGDKVEVTTFRGEGAYQDGRHPDSVVFLDNVVEDLARRDFTINAMALDPLGGEFVDPFGGAEDLARRCVRCVGEAMARFCEDGLRPLRAVRFASVLGFEIELGTRAAIPATLATFGRIARERVREELSKILAGAHPARGVELLRDTGLLEAIAPELAALPADGFAATLRRLSACAPGLELRSAALLWDLGPEAAQQVLERLKHPRAVIDTATALVRSRDFALAGYRDDAALRRALARVGRALAPQLVALGAAEAGREAVAANEAAIARILAQAPALTPGELALDGQAVMRILGVSQGRTVGEALRFLLEQVLDDPSRNTAASLEEILRRRRPPAG